MTIASDLAGVYKQTYADTLENLIPEAVKFVKTVKFIEDEKENGDLYHQPVKLTNEHGFTYAGTNAGAYTLNAAVSMKTKDAQIAGLQMTLRSLIPYDVAAKATKSSKAFRKAVGLIMEDMRESAMKRLELLNIYGSKGIAVAASSVNASTTTTTVQISTATWATGIWAGMENAQVQFYKTSDASLISSSTDSIFVVTTVDPLLRKIVFTGTTTGISALDTALGTVTCDIYFYGAKGSEMSGLDAIITNTGTLFNIDAAAFNLWKANTYAVGGVLTFGKILTAVSYPVARGLDSKATLYVNPFTWAGLANDLASLRKLDSSYDEKKGKNGVESIEFIGQNGVISLVPHSMVKEGEAFMFPDGDMKRVGAQEVSFKTPGRPEQDEIFLHVPDKNGYEIRLWTDQALFCKRPARLLKFTGIVNPS
jgi:hypothetical protein